MPKFVHKGYGIDWETGPIDHAKAVAFEKALKAKGVVGDVPRESWEHIVKAAEETGVVPPLPDDFWDIPGRVEWLAGKVAQAHNQATAVLPE